MAAVWSVARNIRCPAAGLRCPAGARKSGEVGLRLPGSAAPCIRRPRTVRRRNRGGVGGIWTGLRGWLPLGFLGCGRRRCTGCARDCKTPLPRRGRASGRCGITAAAAPPPLRPLRGPLFRARLHAGARQRPAEGGDGRGCRAGECGCCKAGIRGAVRSARPAEGARPLKAGRAPAQGTGGAGASSRPADRSLAPSPGAAHGINWRGRPARPCSCGVVRSSILPFQGSDPGFKV